MRAFSFLAVALMTLLKLSSTQASTCPPGPPLFSPVINNGIVADVTVVRTVDSGPYAGSIEAHVSQVLFGEFSGQTLYFYSHSSGSSLDGCGPGLSSTPGTRSNSSVYRCTATRACQTEKHPPVLSRQPCSYWRVR